ncbi:diguanylate cyclase [Clostridium formicaceticum]|uniref:Circadian input-output histidine kinase CikA n=1 Tax=Clostridium formicaceticum TaxID=1497 RepID=A0AAC9WIK7_9CLOT|nr:diguanylate cyclase [Clostridium formicaceticum]AOY78134.1 hypothetical protein BJL90_21070 [Clostridium formicaceticum]ARE88785.1 Sensory/regulatory protein RpfC [Clostridium formicaceticum]
MLKIQDRWDQFYDLYDKYIAYLVLISCFAGLFMMFTKMQYISADANIPPAQKGMLDISNLDYEQQGFIELKGEWELYHNQLLDDADFAKRRDELEISDYINLPGETIRGAGYSTYRLRIKSQNMQHLDLGIFLPYSLTSYRLIINKKVISETAGFNSKNERAEGIKNKIFHIGSMPEEFEIILNVLNEGDHVVNDPIYLGEYSRILAKHTNNLLRDMFLFSAMIVLGLYHTVLYLFLPKKKYAMFFGMLCIVMAVRTFVTSYSVVITNFIDIGFCLFHYVNYVGGIFGVIYLCNFIHSLFPNEFSNKVLKSIKGYSLLKLMIFIAIPYYQFNYLKNLTNALILMSSLYCTFVLIRAAIKRREGAKIMLIGMFFATIALINDILYVNKMPSLMTFYGLSTFSIVSLAFILALILSKIFANAFVSVEGLSKKLLSLNELKDEFLANTSHELRTPLNGIIGITESLVEGAAGEVTDAVKKNLFIISASARRLSNLVNDILDYSKLKHSDIKLSLGTINLYELIETILTVFKMTQKRDCVLIKNQISKDIPNVYADEDRLQQIMYNLLGNAVKFTKQGEISVDAEVKRNFVQVIVKDTGIGIPHDKTEKIFESFEQIDTSTSRQHSGTGLGLSITKKLVELHGGEITCESIEGKGSKFIFTLPISSHILEKDKETKSVLKRQFLLEQTAVSLEKQEDKDKAKILVVDDETINIQVLVNQLTLNNYYIVTALSGEEALKLIDEIDLDLVILDVMMPGMSGYQVCEKIREKYSLIELPVLMLTANSQLSKICMGFECGANDYIVKPFEKQELLARIKTLITMKNAIKQSAIDPLTGIFNRRRMSELAELIFNQYREENKVFSIVMLDIDNFKKINDKYGHAVGDHVIIELVSRCKEVLRSTDIFGRYGGEEFSLILPNTALHNAVKVAEKIRVNISKKPVKIEENKEIYFTISSGVAQAAKTTESIEEIYMMADKALYKAKEGGKNRVEIML